MESKNAGSPMMQLLPEVSWDPALEKQPFTCADRAGLSQFLGSTLPRHRGWFSRRNSLSYWGDATVADRWYIEGKSMWVSWKSWNISRGSVINTGVLLIRAVMRTKEIQIMVIDSTNQWKTVMKASDYFQPKSWTTDGLLNVMLPEVVSMQRPHIYLNSAVLLKTFGETLVGDVLSKPVAFVAIIVYPSKGVWSMVRDKRHSKAGLMDKVG